MIADPLNHPDWPQIKAYLEPAATRGGVALLEPHEDVWAVYAPDLIGCATTRCTVDKFGEVILVGGRQHRRWIVQLDDKICEWMRGAGMTAVRAYGRKGWVRVLKNWAVLGNSENATGYERRLDV